MTTTDIDTLAANTIRRYILGSTSSLEDIIVAPDGCRGLETLVADLDQLAANTRAKVARLRDRHAAYGTETEETILANRQLAVDAVRPYAGLRYHRTALFFTTCADCGQDTREG